MKESIFFLLSFFICYIFGLIETIIGLGNGLHPDSAYYIENSNEIVFEILANDNLFSVFNNGYYFIVAFLGSSSAMLILLNQIAFAVTNVMMSKCYSRFGIFEAILCFAPYRLHLANHVLKDTMIIFSVVFFLTAAPRGFKFIGISLGILLRLISPVYYLSHFKFSRIVGLTSAFLLSLMLVPELAEFFNDRNDVDMAGREYDLVPNFSNFEFGYYLRFIVWPIIGLSGLTIFLVQTVSILPLAFELIFFGWKCRNRLVSFYLISGIIAMFVTTYTSFLRYIYPLVFVFYLKLYYENRNHRNSRTPR